MISPQVQRHHLVWLDPELDVATYIRDTGHTPFVREWVAQGHPFVAARQPRQTVTGGAHIALGLTLPQPAVRQRISLSVPAGAILRQSGPLDLTLATVPAPHWQELICRILDMCKTAHVTPCVYGSLLWETVGNCKYITDTSDLDVLFICNDSSDITLLLSSLIALDGSTPRLDGEILAPSGWAAAWREVLAAGKPGGSSMVLAKSDCEVRLISLDEFFTGKNE